MSASAIVMMTIAMIIIWGGLLAAILRLRKHPHETDPSSPGAHTAD
ncbi:methionine/alanine import family NSS transporter small subunit [Streptomyces sp. NPDC003023]